MHKLLTILKVGFTGCILLMSISGCGKEEASQSELAVGNWTQLRNRAYILLITNPKGEWNSSVRIADVTSKIVKSKGNAKGTWHIDKGQMIFTVTETDIEDIWEKNATTFYDIIELTEGVMRLRNESGREMVWKQTSTGKTAAADSPQEQMIPMGPVVVNLNKNRSGDKDRYLCLNLNLKLKELMPEQEIPHIHPRAREAANIFLSSLVFNDVKDFDAIKVQGKKLVDVLNPYLEGFVKEVDIEHVIVAAEIDKVEEFIIEHTLTEEPAPEEGAEGEADGEKPAEE
jgi:hypothetical protein